jgi:hypothetical protein
MWNLQNYIKKHAILFFIQEGPSFSPSRDYDCTD